MAVRILTDADVRTLLPMDECMDAMESTLCTIARGNAINPLRSLIRFPDGSGLLGLMPAWLGEPHVSGVKVVTVTHRNHGTEYDSHQGAVLLFEPEHGRLVGVVDASSITAIRTAAVSGVATRRLAREGARSLAILGTGVQAGTHLDAMRVACDLDDIRVWDRTSEHAKRFAARTATRAVGAAQEAVEGADVICTATSSSDPVLQGAWLAPGAHVNAVGACFPTARELDTEAVKRSRLFVDRRESTLNEAGDFLIPKQEGAIDDDHIVAELGEVLLGEHAGRGSEEEVTLFKSLGIGAEDVGAVSRLLEKAEEADAGISVELGGRRDAEG